MFDAVTIGSRLPLHTAACVLDDKMMFLLVPLDDFRVQLKEYILENIWGIVLSIGSEILIKICAQWLQIYSIYKFFIFFILIFYHY